MSQSARVSIVWSILVHWYRDRATKMAAGFASESKIDLLATLQSHLLDEQWTKRLDEQFLSAVEVCAVEEEEEQTHALYECYQRYEQLFDERLMDFCTDHPEFGTSPAELMAQAKQHERNPLLLRLISWTSYEHYLSKVQDMSKQLSVAQEAAELMGL